MNNERNAYGNGTVYFNEKTQKYIVQKYISCDNGKKIRISGSGDTSAKAIKKLKENERKQLLKIKEESAESSKKGTLQDYATEYINAKSGITINTLQNYNFFYKAYIEGSDIGLMEIDTISKDDLMKYYKDKLTNGKLHSTKGEGLSIRSVNYIRMIIMGAMTLAHNKGIIKENVHKQIGKFKNNTADTLDIEEIKRRNREGTDIIAYEELQEGKKAMTKDELNSFIQYAKFDRNYLMYLVTAYTGLRKGEVTALTWNDINFENRTLRVNKGLVYIKDNKGEKGRKAIPYISEPKTKTSKRAIRINEQVVELLKKHKQEQEEEKVKNKALYIDRGLVFCTEVGYYLCHRKILSDFKKIEESAGLKGFNFHTLRHTFCSMLINDNLNINPKIVQEIMGHSSISITMDIYGTLFKDTKMEVMDMLLNKLEIAI